MTDMGSERVMVVPAGVPAMKEREVRLGLADKRADIPRHWSRGQCWCKAVHGGTETGLTFVAPPWDESRDGEAVR